VRFGHFPQIGNFNQHGTTSREDNESIINHAVPQFCSYAESEARENIELFSTECFSLFGRGFQPLSLWFRRERIWLYQRALCEMHIAQHSWLQLMARGAALIQIAFPPPPMTALKNERKNATFMLRLREIFPSYLCVWVYYGNDGNRVRAYANPNQPAPHTLPEYIQLSANVTIQSRPFALWFICV
jgi:hypothetical protein